MKDLGPNPCTCYHAPEQHGSTSCRQCRVSAAPENRCQATIQQLQDRHIAALELRIDSLESSIRQLIGVKK